MNCVIVDDEELDRLMVLSCLKQFPQFNVAGTFSSAIEALDFLSTNPADVLFLDIDMPEMSGIELRKELLSVPVCIFITAYPEHAVESFEVDTLDFLVKPLRLERFRQTAGRIEEYLEIRQKASLFESSVGGDAIFIKEGHTQTKVKLHAILYLEAMKDYTLIITTEKRHCVLSSLGNLLKEPSFQSFVRVHRSFAVQPQQVWKIGPQDIELHNRQVIPVGRGYKDNINKLL
jgi:two-component system, LytTR family, response regulator